jgi:hypothetical protein
MNQLLLEEKEEKLDAIGKIILYMLFTGADSEF